MKTEPTASNTDAAQSDTAVTNYDLVSVDSRQRTFRIKAKERVADKVDARPEEFRKMADAAAKKIAGPLAGRGAPQKYFAT